jgi:hypothetical protein
LCIGSTYLRLLCLETLNVTPVVFEFKNHNYWLGAQCTVSISTYFLPVILCYWLVAGPTFLVVVCPGVLQWLGVDP